MMTENEINKLKRELFLEELLLEQEYKLNARIDKGICDDAQFFSKKMIKALNFDNQDKMTILGNICEKNSHVSYDQLLNQLEQLGYVELIEDETEGKFPVFIANGVDYYLEPHRVGKREFCGVDIYVAVSKEVEEKLQEYCNKELEKVRKEEK